MWNYLSQVGWIALLLFSTHITQAWQIDQMESFKMICISLLASLADQPTNNTTKQGLANIAPPHNRFMITTLSVPHQQFYKSKNNDSWYLWKFLQKEHFCHADWPVLLERMLMAATICPDVFKEGEDMGTTMPMMSMKSWKTVSAVYFLKYVFIICCLNSCVWIMYEIVMRNGIEGGWNYIFSTIWCESKSFQEWCQKVHFKPILWNPSFIPSRWTKWLTSASYKAILRRSFHSVLEKIWVVAGKPMTASQWQHKYVHTIPWASVNSWPRRILLRWCSLATQPNALSVIFSPSFLVGSLKYPSRSASNCSREDWESVCDFKYLFSDASPGPFLNCLFFASTRVVIVLQLLPSYACCFGK